MGLIVALALMVAFALIALYLPVLVAIAFIGLTLMIAVGIGRAEGSRKGFLYFLREVFFGW